jgi:membrane-associated phospholipid phosphatase
VPDVQAWQRRRVMTAGRIRVVREILTVALAALLYFFVRGLMHSQVGDAMAHARALISLEQQLGIFHEPWLQSQVTSNDWMMNLANRIYIFGHWPVIAGTMTWLIWKHREWFAVYRSALLISGAIGLVVFVTLPMAPPRFVTDQGFVDTVTQHSHAYRVLQPPAFTNQYAAMPSLHVGWNLLMGIAIVRHASTRWARAFGWTMPLVMWIATIVTANHYLVDGVAGAIVALTGLAVAWKISRPHRTEAEDDDVEVFQGPVIGQGWNSRHAA